jgi:hypothetical protein
MNIIQGFLVVLKTAETHSLMKNKQYRGVYRMPSYKLKNQHPIDSEIEAMDHYIFGDVRDEDSGLIPSFEAALELLFKFKNSPREFEIIWCRIIDEELNTSHKASFGQSKKVLGFDVASRGGDFWSIVGDFPSDNRIVSYFAKLNGQGLFDSSADAREYLSKYQSLMLPDYDSPFQVIEVHLLNEPTSQP